MDVYGDSYGTFFAQVLAGRHPDQVRSVVLDSAYPAYGEDAWYPTQGPAMPRRSRRLPAYPRLPRRRGPSWRPCRGCSAAVRANRGTGTRRRGRPPDAGHVDGPSLAPVAFGATYAPAFYRELTAALRSALTGDRGPLLRLVAEATGGGTDAGPVAPTARGSTPPSPATTTHSSTT